MQKQKLYLFVVLSLTQQSGRPVPQREKAASEKASGSSGRRLLSVEEGRRSFSREVAEESR